MGNNHRAAFWFKVACPKCGSAVGINCFRPKALRSACYERVKLAVASGFDTLRPLGLSTPKCRLPKKRVPVVERSTWISTACNHQNHFGCNSRHCVCKCHEVKL